MKNLIFIFSLLAASLVNSQINYQAVYSPDGIPAVDQEISVSVSILSGSVSGNVVYEESHNVTTNSNAVFSLVIGEGQVMQGSTLESINWSADNFLSIEIDGVNLGTTQIMSVPSAYYAKKASGLTLDNSVELVEGVDYIFNPHPAADYNTQLILINDELVESIITSTLISKYSGSSNKRSIPIALTELNVYDIVTETTPEVEYFVIRLYTHEGVKLIKLVE